MLNFFWKRYKKELIFILILFTGLTALFSRLNQFGISMITGAVLIYLYVKLQPGHSSELKQLRQEVHNQKKEIEELRSRKLNIAGMKDILEIGLIEIDTNFTRTWNEKFSDDDKDLHFIGALQIQLVAKYGINLKDLKVKIDHQNKLIFIAGLQPEFLSFSEINHEWKIAEMLEYKKRPLNLGSYWKKSEKYQELLNRKMEEKRKQVYAEIKQGPEEIQWLTKLLYQQVENTMRLLLNRSDLEINFVKQADEDFYPIEIFLEKTLKHT